MWEDAEYSFEPEALDVTSSSYYVYVRKDIVFNADKNIWTCQEQKVQKTDWYIYEEVLKNKADISDVEDALIELAGMIGG